MLVQVVDVVEDGKRMEPRVLQLERLARPDLVNPLGRHAAERRLALHVPVLLLAHDGKPGPPAGSASAGKHELPDEVVERRPQVADHVAEEQSEPLERQLLKDVPAQRVPACLGSYSTGSS